MRQFHRLFEADLASDAIVGDEIRGDIDAPDSDGSFAAFRQAWRQGADLPDLFGRRPLDIRSPVTPFGPHRKADLAKLETFLDRTGHLDLAPTEGPTGQPSIRLDDAIRDFQAERGLMVDGVVNPKGETHRSLTAELQPATRMPRSGSLITGGSDPSTDANFGPRRAESDPTDLRRVRPAQVGSETSGKPSQEDRQSRASPLPSRTKKRFPVMHEGEGIARIPAIRKKVEQIDRKMREKLAEAKSIQRTLRENGITAFQVPKATAAFERYLNGTGGSVDYDPKWVLSHPKMAAAAKANEKKAETWILEKNRARLEALREGESITIKSSEFRSDYRIANETRSDHGNLFGDGHIKATAELTFTRRGGIIEVSGFVNQRIRDVYDWKPGQVFEFELPDVFPVSRIPREFRPKVTIKSDELIFLHKFGRARTFVTKSAWKRKITRRIRVATDPKTGKLRILGFEEQ